MSPSPPLVVADRYRLVAPLGQGGMGRVWRATDVVLHREVAIKELVPPPGLTPGERQEMRERSLREARAIARLNNINVVRVFDVLRTDADPWIVMEYVPSRSLQDTLAADGPFSPVRAAEIGLGVLNALRAAHRAGVVHRDVKPGNVLIGADGRVVLTDFGLATVPGDPNVTRTGLVLGSPAYIAPERARDGSAGPAADLWSLGATLFAAVEGASPFARPSAIATLAALATENPPPARNAGPLKPVLNGLLRKDPTHRINAEEAERLLLRATGRRSKLSFPMSPTMRRPGVGRDRSALTGGTSATPVVPGPRPPVARPSGPPVTPGRPAAGEDRPPIFAPGKAPVGRSTPEPPTRGRTTEPSARGRTPETPVRGRTTEPPARRRPAAETPTRVDGPKVEAPRLDATRVDGPPIDATRVDGPPIRDDRTTVVDGTPVPPGPPAGGGLSRTSRGAQAGFTAADVAANRRKKAAPEHEKSLSDATALLPRVGTDGLPNADKPAADPTTRIAFPAKRPSESAPKPPAATAADTVDKTTKISEPVDRTTMLPGSFDKTTKIPGPVDKTTKNAEPAGEKKPAAKQKPVAQDATQVVNPAKAAPTKAAPTKAAPTKAAPTKAAPVPATPADTKSTGTTPAAATTAGAAAAAAESAATTATSVESSGTSATGVKPTAPADPSSATGSKPTDSVSADTESPGAAATGVEPAGAASTSIDTAKTTPAEPGPAADAAARPAEAAPPKGQQAAEAESLPRNRPAPGKSGKSKTGKAGTGKAEPATSELTRNGATSAETTPSGQTNGEPAKSGTAKSGAAQAGLDQSQPAAARAALVGAEVHEDGKNEPAGAGTVPDDEGRSAAAEGAEDGTSKPAGDNPTAEGDGESAGADTLADGGGESAGADVVARGDGGSARADVVAGGGVESAGADAVAGDEGKAAGLNATAEGDGQSAEAADGQETRAGAGSDVAAPGKGKPAAAASKGKNKSAASKSVGAGSAVAASEGVNRAVSTGPDQAKADRKAAGQPKPDVEATTTLAAAALADKTAKIDAPARTAKIGGDAEGRNNVGDDADPLAPLPAFNRPSRPAWTPMPHGPTPGITVFGTRLTYGQAAIGGGIILLVLVLVIVLIGQSFGDGGDEGDNQGQPAVVPPSATAPAAGANGGASATPSKAATTKPSPASAAPSTTPALSLPSTWRMYSDPTGFKIPLPKSAQISRSGSEVEVRWSNRFLLIDQTDDPRDDAIEDYKQQERDRAGRDYRNYEKVKLVEVKNYFKQTADWEFYYTTSTGNRQHAVKRNIIVSDKQAYSISWYVSPEDWKAAQTDLQLLYQGFEPKK